jgi:hypothetical protein
VLPAPSTAPGHGATSPADAKDAGQKAKSGQSDMAVCLKGCTEHSREIPRRGVNRRWRGAAAFQLADHGLVTFVAERPGRDSKHGCHQTKAKAHPRRHLHLTLLGLNSRKL